MKNKDFEYDYSEELTREHIQLGTPKNTQSCAVALFLTDIKEKPVVVSREGAWLAEEKHDIFPTKGKKIASFGKKMRDFIREFDRKEPCQPQKIGVKVGPRGGVKMEIVD